MWGLPASPPSVKLANTGSLTAKLESYEKISTFFARLIARELSFDAHPWPGLLAGLSLTEEQIMSQPMMEAHQFNQLLNNALTISADPGLGLRFGRHAQLLANGELGSTVFSAPTLREVLRGLDDFSRLQAEYLSMGIKVEGSRLQLREQEDISLSDTRITQHEVMVLCLQNTIEMVLGRPFTEGQYHFAFTAPTYNQRYCEVFHSPYHFDATATGVDIPRQLLDLPSPYFDSQVWHRGRSRATALMTELNNRHKRLHSQHILGMLRSQLPPLPNLKQISESMLLSERSLIRRLESEGVRFRQLQSQVLKEWAHHYLVDTGLSIDAIACQLGYQDTANFRRAFKRWYQSTPSEYRKAKSAVV